MNLADFPVVYCVSGLSFPSFKAVSIKDLHCRVSRSSKTSAPSCTPLFIVFQTRSHQDALRLFELFTNETKLTGQTQSVDRIVNPEVFSVPCHFPAHEVDCFQESRINTFTGSCPERFTHQLLKVVNDAISPMNTARLQRCFPVPPWHQCVFLKTLFVGTFLHMCCKHLICATDTATILGKNSKSYVSCRGPWALPRRTMWYLCSSESSNPRNLHSPKEHAEEILDADEDQSSHSTIHISWYTWSLILAEYCLLDG